jgi:DtxR family Mn-dependent transcriptional regulator
MLSTAEENYLKAIFQIAEREGAPVNTNAVAAAMQTTAASVTDMLKRLTEKNLLHYEKYRGVQLSPEGTRVATYLIRKHRLWEVFLTEKLGFAWDEVHEIAEELEHIQSDDLVVRLDQFLGHPRFDPHGDPIPDAEGRWAPIKQVTLSSLQPGQFGIITGVDDHSATFLQYLQHNGLTLGVNVRLLEVVAYDQSLLVQIEPERTLTLSEKVGRNLFVKTADV